MNEEKLKSLKRQYLNTPIPEELESIVENILIEKNLLKMKRNKWQKKAWLTAASIIICFAVLTVGINTSQALASTLSKVPVVASIVKVLTFKEYTVDNERFKANIKVPSVEGLENKELEHSLNEKYLAENKKLYEEFMAEMEEMKKNGNGYLGVDSGYEVVTDTDRLLSIRRHVLSIAGSAQESFKYDTIDKKAGVLITLPSLFKDDRYIEIISENIKEQMRERMNANDGFIYWIDVDEDEEFIEPFEKIEPKQNFYITEDGKLVISFDEYEVGPGYMGVQEFVIPTEILSDILVSNKYIK